MCLKDFGGVLYSYCSWYIFRILKWKWSSSSNGPSCSPSFLYLQCFHFSSCWKVGSHSVKETSIWSAGSFLKADGGRRMGFGLNCCGWSLPLQGFFFTEAERQGVINESPLRLSRGEDWSSHADVGVTRPTAPAIGKLLTAAASIFQNILHLDVGIMISLCYRLARCTFSWTRSLSLERSGPLWLFIPITLLLDSHCIMGCNFLLKRSRKQYSFMLRSKN